MVKHAFKIGDYVTCESNDPEKQETKAMIIGMMFHFSETKEKKLSLYYLILTPSGEKRKVKSNETLTKNINREDFEEELTKKAEEQYMQILKIIKDELEQIKTLSNKKRKSEKRIQRISKKIKKMSDKMKKWSHKLSRKASKTKRKNNNNFLVHL